MGTHMKDPILLTGEGKLSYTVAACLFIAGHEVVFASENPETARENVEEHLRLSEKSGLQASGTAELNIVSTLQEEDKFRVVILITGDRLEDKIAAVRTGSRHVSADGILAINMESIELGELQSSTDAPERLIGLNWSLPAHTTFFLEIIGNTLSDEAVLNQVMLLGKEWGKDPYIVRSGFSVRARLNAALTREALYLVANGYADHEDIDRNCRNDAGYYLPFAGNARYMDLMGTYAYGVVMKDLNRQLSSDRMLDPATEALLKNGNLGMESGQGFFSYSKEETQEWKNKMNSFSYQIHRLIKKYAFETASTHPSQ